MMKILTKSFRVNNLLSKKITNDTIVFFADGIPATSISISPLRISRSLQKVFLSKRQNFSFILIDSEIGFNVIKCHSIR